MGTTEPNTVKICVKEMNLPITCEEFQEEFTTRTCNYLPSSELMPGVERLVRYLAKNDIPAAIATSSGEESVRLKISRHQNLFKLFTHFVMGSSDPEVKYGKPHPDIFLIAASRFHDSPNPEQVRITGFT